MTLKTEAIGSSFGHRQELFKSRSCFCQYSSVDKTLIDKHRSRNPYPTLPPKTNTFHLSSLMLQWYLTGFSGSFGCRNLGWRESGLSLQYDSKMRNSSTRKCAMQTDLSHFSSLFIKQRKVRRVIQTVCLAELEQVVIVQECFPHQKLLVMVPHFL